MEIVREFRGYEVVYGARVYYRIDDAWFGYAGHEFTPVHPMKLDVLDAAFREAFESPSEYEEAYVEYDHDGKPVKYYRKR